MRQDRSAHAIRLGHEASVAHATAAVALFIAALVVGVGAFHALSSRDYERCVARYADKTEAQLIALCGRPQ